MNICLLSEKSFFYLLLNYVIYLSNIYPLLILTCFYRLSYGLIEEISGRMQMGNMILVFFIVLGTSLKENGSPFF